jgi:hypothetical protein
VYDDELTKLLADTMQSAGMVQPIVVIDVGDGYHLVDGLHRLQETIKSGGTEIDAVVYSGEAKTALLLNLVTNHTRGKTKASELVKVIGALQSDYGMNFGEIVEKTGFGRDYTERLLSISSAHPEVLDLLDREIIGVGQAYEISRLPNIIQQQELVRTLQVFRMTTKDVAAYVDKVLTYMQEYKEQPVQAKPSIIPRSKCQCCDDEFDAMHVRSILLCPDCFGEVFKLQRDKREIRARAEVKVGNDSEHPT